MVKWLNSSVLSFEERPRNDTALVHEFYRFSSGSPRSASVVHSLIFFVVSIDSASSLKIIMASKPFCPSVALLRSLNRASSPPQCLRETALRHHRALHASSTLTKEPKSFHGQLYESTAERVKKERAEQERFAEARGENNKGRSAAITAGTIGLDGMRRPRSYVDLYQSS